MGRGGGGGVGGRSKFPVKARGSCGCPGGGGGVKPEN